MKKYSSREKRLLKWAIIAVAFYLLNGQWKNYQQVKKNLVLDIQTEQANQSSYNDRLLAFDKETLIRETEAMETQLGDFQDRVLRMDQETEAQFRFQEDVAKMAEKAQINLSSASKRNSKMVLEETGLMEIKTYFTFDCEISNLLNFFDDLQHLPYYVAIETLTVNSYSNRRARPPRGKNQDDSYTTMEKLRGTAILTALFRAGKPIVKSPDLPESAVPIPSQASEPVPSDEGPIDSEGDNGRVQAPVRQPVVTKMGTQSGPTEFKENPANRPVEKKPEPAITPQPKTDDEGEPEEPAPAQPKKAGETKPPTPKPDIRTRNLPPKPQPVSPGARQKQD
ncbi:MAG: hypothetical protein H6510_14005 [Acidobacteria bacterium]|nr:hypothetical protein [Acidobacteriota bacterium]MCB9398922.1 hypothetical protein [Acidobacteriota bacterium]